MSLPDDRGGTSIVPSSLRCVLLGILVMVMACGGDRPDGYSADHRADFVEDCTTDSASAETCGCFYDRVAAELPFERFEELDEQLRDPSSPVPPALAEWAGACGVEQRAPDGD